MDFKCKHCENDTSGKCPVKNHNSEDLAPLMCFTVRPVEKKVEMCAYLPGNDSDTPDDTAIFDGRSREGRRWNRVFVLYWLRRGALITSEVIE